MRNRRRRSRPLLASMVAVVAVAVIGYVDYRTGPDLAFTITYLLPVLFAARYGPPGSGLVTALLGSVSMLVAERLAGHVYTSALVTGWNVMARFGVLAVMALLVRSLRTQLALAHFQARTDSLTGLVSRGRFLELLEGEVRRTRRYGHPLSLAYIDVDDFKTVNDTEGHAAGDRLLRCIADALRDGTRAIDIAGRMGGDEFMLLMPETEPADARALVERLQHQLGETRCVRDSSVTFSIGVLTFLGLPEGPDQAVQQVDHLMYEVKRTGKDGFLHQIVD